MDIINSNEVTIGGKCHTFGTSERASRTHSWHLLPSHVKAECQALDTTSSRYGSERAFEAGLKFEGVQDDSDSTCVLNETTLVFVDRVADRLDGSKATEVLGTLSKANRRSGYSSNGDLSILMVHDVTSVLPPVGHFWCYKAVSGCFPAAVRA